jgi:hypothetical protein
VGTFLQKHATGITNCNHHTEIALRGRDGIHAHTEHAKGNIFLSSSPMSNPQIIKSHAYS